MKQALRDFLLADDGVAGLVGARVSWATRPRRAALPSIVMTQISGVRDYHMVAPSRLVTSRVQVDCWALSNAEAEQLAVAVNGAMSGLRMTLTVRPNSAPVQIQGAFLESQIDLSEDGSTPPDEMLHRISMDFMVWHDE